MTPPLPESGRSAPVARLDITGEVCPLTFVRTKLLIERLAVGDIAEVRLKGREPLENVPRSLLEHGHAVLAIEPESTPATADTPHRLYVRKGG